MNCLKDTAPDNTVLWPIALARTYPTPQAVMERWNENHSAFYILQRTFNTIFVRVVNVITDHKPVVAVSKKI